jgi:hypothetical protein
MRIAEADGKCRVFSLSSGSFDAASARSNGAFDRLHERAQPVNVREFCRAFGN